MSYITEERRLIQESAREFAMREVLPLANKLDPEQGEIPMALRDKLAEMGYFGITIPEEYGGLGLGAFEYCLITEELARAWMSVASLVARGNGLIGSRAMNEEQKRRYLTRVAKGEFLGAFSMSEPGAGSDIANVTCRAREDGDSWVINGNKYWCTFADGADYIMLVARTSEPPDNRRRHLGLSTFLIEKPRGELPKGCAGNPIPKIGYFGWKTFELSFDNCRIGAECLVGEEGRAFYVVTQGRRVGEDQPDPLPSQIPSCRITAAGSSGTTRRAGPRSCDPGTQKRIAPKELPVSFPCEDLSSRPSV